MKWYDPTVYDAMLMNFIVSKYKEYMLKAMAIEALGNIFAFVSIYGYEHAKNIQPKSLDVLVEAVKQLYDMISDGEEESQVSLALEHLLSEILRVPEVLEALYDWKDRT
jgi:hypothetical protein